MKKLTLAQEGPGRGLRIPGEDPRATWEPRLREGGAGHRPVRWGAGWAGGQPWELGWTPRVPRRQPMETSVTTPLGATRRPVHHALIARPR